MAIAKNGKKNETKKTSAVKEKSAEKKGVSGAASSRKSIAAEEKPLKTAKAKAEKPLKTEKKITAKSAKTAAPEKKKINAAKMPEPETVKKEEILKTVKASSAAVKTKTADTAEVKERVGVKKTLTSRPKSSGPAKTEKNGAVSKTAVKDEKKSKTPAGAKAKTAIKKTAAEKSPSKVQKREVKKVVVKTPLAKPEAMNVISSDVENLYGKHYIINTAQELPESYGKNRLITLVRDPEWIYTFWDVAGETITEIKNTMGAKEFNDAKRILRLYDGGEAGNYSDIELTDTASSWYIHVKPEARYVLELGYRSKTGDFYKMASSNDVAMPSQRVSEHSDEKWMVKDGVFEKIYELSGGSQLGMSSADIMQAMARGMKPEEFSQLISRGISSETLSSQFAAEKAREEQEVKKQRKFWMVLNTELIVYGATEPDASVTLMDKPIKLRPDGTFSIRMALPDGDVDIPAVGVSADKIDKITITPEVHKRTHYSKAEKESAL
ncbi:MAG: hypothetical protein BWY32_00624 [bacterium ADurb.Bin243]|nr:MAG: hypothetical protein BWY32_00624 [bacterium ADurb.Bin243]